MKTIRMLVPLLSLVLLAVPGRGEEFICTDGAGCGARINQGNGVEEEVFRQGDIISTDAGWVVSPDDGWRKIKKPKWSDPVSEPRRCWCGLIHPPQAAMGGGYTRPTPHLRPVPLQILIGPVAAQRAARRARVETPPSLSLVGLTRIPR